VHACCPIFFLYVIPRNMKLAYSGERDLKDDVHVNTDVKHVRNIGTFAANLQSLFLEADQFSRMIAAAARFTWV
jgi:hypothetical protein